MMSTIAELEAAVNTEQEALERAYQAANQVSIAMYTTSLRRAEQALLAERIRLGEW